MPEMEPKAARFLALFEEGRRFTEELLRENEKLRLTVARLQRSTRQLKRQAEEAGPEQLQRRIAGLEEALRQQREQRSELERELATVASENCQFADRYVEVERQNSDLISMYVASYRLHSTLDYDEVLKIVKEIIVNLIGSEQFGIYLVDEDQGCLTRIAHEGDDPRNVPQLPLDQGIVAEVLRSKEPYVASSRSELEQRQEPIACVPLTIDGTVLGLFLVHQLLVQKGGFEAIDLGLFELLGAHAATAIYGAKLYSRSERKRTTLEGMVELIKQDLTAPC